MMRVKPCSRLGVSSVLSGARCQRDSESRARSESAQGDMKLKGPRGKAVKEYRGKKSGEKERWKGDGGLERRKHSEAKDSVSSNKEITETEIRERRIMKPEGFKAYLFNVQNSTDPVLSLLSGRTM